MSTKQPTFDELKAFLPLDSDALDDCLMEQAKLYEQVGEATVSAEGARDLAELELEELVAATDQDIRQTADAAKAKTTESAIKAEIATDRQVMAQNRKVLDLQLTAKKWRVLERSFDQRADMLKKLVDLHLRTAYGYSLESGVGQARGNLIASKANEAEEAVRAKRRVRLEEKA